jgi:DNA-binding MarR family transcriptional regulator
MAESKKEFRSKEGRFAYARLERLMHERSRLGILASLVSHPQGVVFNDLKKLVSLTDGNLSRQLQILAGAGLVEVWKGQKGSRPQTLCRLTTEGRERFREYVAELENVVSDAVAAEGERKSDATMRGRREELA